MKTLGERLKDLRKEKGYTLEQVAEKLNKRLENLVEV